MQVTNLDAAPHSLSVGGALLNKNVLVATASGSCLVMTRG